MSSQNGKSVGKFICPGTQMHAHTYALTHAQRDGQPENIMPIGCVEA